MFQGMSNLIIDEILYGATGLLSESRRIT